MFDALTRAQTNDELTAIRAELVEQGYLRRKGPAAKKGKEPKLSPKRYRSDDGFTILVGRNNVQNDQLTLKEAHGRDVWFHTKNIPGSHTVVLSEGREVPDSTLHQAAILAAVNSKAADSSQVPVDYTLIKNVKKPRGAKPAWSSMSAIRPPMSPPTWSSKSACWSNKERKKIPATWRGFFSFLLLLYF